jgi:hypothetical protein
MVNLGGQTMRFAYQLKKPHGLPRAAFFDFLLVSRPGAVD